MASGLLSDPSFGNQSIFNVGIQNVTYFARDAAGNNNTCTFTVTVLDVQPPTLNCSTNLNLFSDPGVCKALVNYSLPSVWDNCNSLTPVLQAGFGPNSNFSVGSTVVTYNATDLARNSNACTFSVTVTDGEAPKLTCFGDVSVNTLPNLCYSNVTYREPITTDNCAVQSLFVDSSLQSGLNYSIGSYVVNWTSTDVHGLSSSCAFSINVADKEAPQLSCPTNIQQNTQTNYCTARISFGTFSATDNCAVSQSGLASNALYGNNSIFSLGNQSVTYFAQDASGNNASCSFIVSVQDHQSPTITCPVNLQAGTDFDVCVAVVNYSTPSYWDNCPSSSLALTSGSSALSNFSVGNTSVTYTVTDGSQNSASCTFNIIVSDIQAPEIICPANISVNATQGLCSSQVTFAEPFAWDNCHVANVLQTAGLTNGSAFPVGTTIVTYQAADSAGLTASCSFAVQVIDNQTPILSVCPSNIVHNADSGFCTTVVTYNVPNGSDNCPFPNDCCDWSE